MEVSEYLHVEASHQMPHIQGQNVVEYQCDFCEGLTVIVVVKNEEKVTIPTVEFCPLCGNSVAYPWPKEAEE